MPNEFNGPEDFRENSGYNFPYDEREDQIVKALTEDPETLGGSLRMGSLSRQEMDDRVTQLFAGLTHGDPLIFMTALAAIHGSGGRDGDRARQLVGLAGGQGYFSNDQRRGGFFGRFRDMLFGQRQAAETHIPPDMRAPRT